MSENNFGSVVLRVTWGDSTLKVLELDPPRSFTVGEGGDYPLPVEKVELLSVDGGCVSLLGERLELDVEKSVEVGGVTFHATLGERCERIRGGWRLGGGAAFQGLSAVIHGALFGSMYFLTPALGATEYGEMSDEQRFVLTQVLDTVAEREEERRGDVGEVLRGGDVGSSSKGDEGNMGRMNSTETGKHYTVRGSKENVDTHISRSQALRDAMDFGMIGILNSGGGGDPDSPTAPWGGDESLGRDDVSHLGSLWGDGPGDDYGTGGLGLSGVGEGSGGPGEGIGVGPNLGGLGRDLKEGFGPSGVMKGGHKVREVRMRQGLTNSSGRIPPEVIQRIVRQNQGRFRACYEVGLRGNPSLAGRVAVRFVIGRDGSVTTANNGGSDLPDSGVVGCVVNSFRGLSFPAPEDGIVTVGYSIQLSPG